ncbi:MAG: SCO family protein [Solirubrobacterales bacterium]|nr:SCO family protein [Solirubrobacterales bacterium]
MQPRLRLALFLAGIFAITAAAAVLLFAVGTKTVSATAFSGALRPPGIPPEEFGMRDEHGRVVRLAGLRGKPVVVTFLYTTCEDTCPLTVDQIRLGLDELGHDVPVIAVSVDPRNDTRGAARRFSRLRQMTGRMRWVLGSERELRRVWRAYGVQPQTDRDEHSASTVLLDGRGRQRIGFSTSVLTPDALAHDIAVLEREERAAG